MMRFDRRMRHSCASLAPVLAMLLAASLPGIECQAQGVVAFQPEIGVMPSGVSLPVTPVVSANRRYVRLGLNPQFTDVQGFQNFPVPAAVAGGNFSFGPGTPGGFAGMDGPVLFDSAETGRSTGIAPGRSSTDMASMAGRAQVSTSETRAVVKRPRRKKARAVPLKPAVKAPAEPQRTIKTRGAEDASPRSPLPR